MPTLCDRLHSLLKVYNSLNFCQEPAVWFYRMNSGCNRRDINGSHDPSAVFATCGYHAIDVGNKSLNVKVEPISEEEFFIITLMGS